MNTDVNWPKKVILRLDLNLRHLREAKSDEFLSKALPLNHGGFYWKEYRIVWYQWKESRINYTYLQFTEIVWKNGKCSFSLNSLAQSENCLWYGLICIKTSVKSGSKESKLFKKLTFTLWQVCTATPNGRDFKFDQFLDSARKTSFFLLEFSKTD